jgi:membrane protein
MAKPALPEPHAGREVLRHLWRFSALRYDELLELLNQTVSEWIDDKAPRLSASLAFYSLLSIAPLLVVVVAVAALVYGRDAARGQLVWQIQGLVGPEVAKEIQGLILGAYKPAVGVLASVLGLPILAFGASSVVVELRDALNTIWHVESDRHNIGLASMLCTMKERFYSFVLILGVGFLLLASLALNTLIAAIGGCCGSFLQTSEVVLHSGAFVLTFLVITFLFAAIYRLLPDVHLRWSDVVIGASATSLLFSAGKQLFALYLGRATFGSTYGAAGSLVVLLVWVHYSAMLFFMGAEFTKVYTKKFGSHFSNQLQVIPPVPGKALIDPSSGLAAGFHEAGDPSTVERGCARDE